MKSIKTLFFTFLVVPMSLLAASDKYSVDPDPTGVTSTKAVFLDSKTKAPLAGVTVYVKNLNDNTITKSKTDARGMVVISGTLNCDVEIVVEKSGYKKLEVKSSMTQSSQYFSLTKEETVMHPFIRFK